MTAMEGALLSVSQLKASLVARTGSEVLVLDSVTFDVAPGEAIGLVGESGSGKSMTCRALLGVLGRYGGRVVGGSIRYQGQELVGADANQWRRVRNELVGFVPQSSLVGLNPVLTVDAQFREVVERVSPGERSRPTSAELLDMVRLPKRALRLRAFELSGGMRQRAMIALALAKRPRLLVADEPTTALDVTIQREILDTIAGLRSHLDLAVILVSHDLAVIEDVCDRTVVMYAGATMEIGETAEMLGRASHPYTLALQASRVDRVTPGQNIQAIDGDAPLVGDWPEGCRFWPRCSYRLDACSAGDQPPLVTLGARQSACIRADELGGGLMS